MNYTTPTESSHYKREKNNFFWRENIWNFGIHERIRTYTNRKVHLGRPRDESDARIQIGVNKVDQLLTHNVCHIACHHINCATGIKISEISFMNLVRPREFIVNRTE